MSTNSNLADQNRILEDSSNRRDSAIGYYIILIYLESESAITYRFED